MRELSAAELSRVTEYCQDASDAMLFEELKYVEIFKDNEIYYSTWKTELDKEVQRRGLV